MAHRFLQAAMAYRNSIESYLTLNRPPASEVKDEFRSLRFEAEQRLHRVAALGPDKVAQAGRALVAEVVMMGSKYPRVSDDAIQRTRQSEREFTNVTEQALRKG